MRRLEHRGCTSSAYLAAAAATITAPSLQWPFVQSSRLLGCFLIILITLTQATVRASEFPERECCDPVYPLPAPPASTTPYPSVPTATGRVGLNPKSAVAILNCLLARQLCFEDASCSAILEIIPRVCGPEQVACSTVTVTKCQAALRTLQAFPFFRPTCLCREPHVDPECNSFRDFLFDHPCIFVNKKEKDPYPVDALPTCNHALSVCQLERKCIKLFEDFKSSCKVRDGRCRMDERESCHAAWTKLRLSPMFGCICPNNHMKRRCDRIFSMVNHNPCVDVLPASLDLSGTDSALYPYDPEQDKFREFWFPPTSLYPYFLLPPTLRPRLTHMSSSNPQQPYNVPPYDTHTNNHLTVEDPILIPIDASGGTSNIKLTSSRSGSISVKVISSENTSFDGIESQLENPLFGIRGANQKDINTLRQELQGFKDNINASVFDEDGEARGSISSHSSHVNSKGPTSAESEVEVKNFNFQSTCHLALDMCNNNYNCRVALQPVLQYCELSRCTRDACMAALQNFYRTTELKWSLEVAFCLCKKTDNKQDECLVAQEKLHPLCAQRVEGSSMPTCHSLAETCREEHTCRSSLEYYEQSCAVDSVTKKCAGPPAECRKAMLGILGTSLRSNCACKGTDFSQLYDCLGWQRLLWVNPCVVESQKDFHAKRISEAQPQTTTPARNVSTWTPAPPAPPAPPSTVTTVTSPATWPPSVGVNFGPIILTEPTPTIPVPAAPVPAVPLPTTTLSEVITEEPSTSPTTPTTTLPTTTTEPPRYCIVQRPHQNDQSILEGTGKRLYRENEPECSELCQCNEGEQLVCNTLCVDRAPCKTDFAFYNHAAPAYQAYRGRCMCYSGKFICMRPSPDTYNLPLGVFLFLGYSETDETLLKPHSNLTIHDTVDALQQLLRFEPSKKGECALFLYNVTKENVIIVAKLVHENFTFTRDVVKRTSLDQLQHEKEECSGPLQDLSDKINNQHTELHSHQLLSILKMAEVEVKVPESNRASRLYAGGLPLCLLVLALLYAHTWGPAPS